MKTLIHSTSCMRSPLSPKYYYRVRFHHSAFRLPSQGLCLVAFDAFHVSLLHVQFHRGRCAEKVSLHHRHHHLLSPLTDEIRTKAHHPPQVMVLVPHYNTSTSHITFSHSFFGSSASISYGKHVECGLWTTHSSFTHCQSSLWRSLGLLTFSFWLNW